VKIHQTDGLKVLGLDAAAYEVLRPAVFSLERGRSADTREALEELAQRVPDYAALRQYVLSGILAKDDIPRGVAAYRAAQAADGIASRFAHCHLYAQGGRPLPEDGAPFKVMSEGESGGKTWEDYGSVWKLAGGSRVYECKPAAAGLVVDGLLKKHIGDEESCFLEVECEGARERVRFNSNLMVLGSTSEAARARLSDRFVPFRLVAHRDQFRLYVDGLTVLHSPSPVPLGEVRTVRFGLLPGVERIDTNFLLSSWRLCWGVKARVDLEDLAPFAGFDLHLNNLAIAWHQLGQPARAVALMASAVETHPRPEILDNFVILVERLAGDLEVDEPALRRGLGVVALKLGEDRAAHLRTLMQQKRRAIAVSCQDVSVYFARAPHRVVHPVELAKRLLRPRRYFEKNYWWAVRNVSFDLRYGETLAIIGNNGAGKSTLLRAVAGILDYRGTLVVNGDPRLLVMGLGIQEELTGRDNVMLGCLYLGMRRRAALAQMAAILDFAGLTEFADVPYKYYSDGMKARLMFSIATSIEPDILLLDELLGAGDVTFRAKAMERMNDLLRSCKAMIIVTHNLAFVREKARRAIYLDKGRVRYHGDANRAVDLYLQETAQGGAAVGRGGSAYLMEEV
jgi:ABC-type polysaccharide/polyol phosphate transport system ATPase subunit